jgi:transcriptional regulator with XRE-family HTH domain
MATLGERIRALRKEKRMNRDQLGQSVGVTGSAVSMWEIDRRIPPAKVLEELCDLFDVQYDYLVGKSDYRSAEDEILDRIGNEFRQDAPLSEDEQELLHSYRSAKAEHQEVIRDLAKMYGKQ